MIHAYRVMVEFWVDDEVITSPPDPTTEATTFIDKLVGEQFTIAKASVEKGVGQGAKDIAGNVSFKLAEFHDVTPVITPPLGP